MNEGTKLGNDENDGTTEADGSKEVEGTAVGLDVGLRVGDGRPSGDIDFGGRVGAVSGRADGAIVVGTTLSFLVGTTEGIIDSTSMGGAVGAVDKIGVAAGVAVIGAVVITGAIVTKSSAKHLVWSANTKHVPSQVLLPRKHPDASFS